MSTIAFEEVGQALNDWYKIIKHFYFFSGMYEFHQKRYVKAIIGLGTMKQIHLKVFKCPSIGGVSMKKRTVLITAAILGLLLFSAGNDFGTKENGWFGISKDFQTAENGALG